MLLRYSWEKILLCAGWSDGATSGLVEASRASVNNKTCNHQQNRWSFLQVTISLQALAIQKKNVKLNVNS